MGTAQNLLKSSAARVAFSLISAVAAFFMMPFLVGHLGERWYGIWVLVASLTAGSYLLDFGLSMAVLRFVAAKLAVNDTRGANEVINTCLAIYAVLAVVVFGAAVTVAAYSHLFIDDPDSAGIVRATIILIGLQYASEFPFKAFAGVVASYVRYDLLMVSRLFNLVATNVLFVVLVRSGYGILGLAVTVVAVDQITNFMYFWIAKHLFRDLTISRAYVRRDLVRELFSYSTWSFVVMIANQFRFRIDSLVIGWMISVSAVTHYAVGQRLVEYFVDVVNRATNMMTPIFTAHYVQNDLAELRRKYLLITRISATFALFGGGMIIILAKAFIIRWMGAGFEQSYTVVVVLMCAMVFDVIGSHSDNMFYAASKHRFLACFNVAESILNVVLSVALAPRFGIVGVALGTAIPLLCVRLFVIPPFVAHFIGLPTRHYYRNLVPVAVFTVTYLAAVHFLAQSFLDKPSYAAIVAVGILATPLYVLAAPFIVLDARERSLVMGLIPGPLRRWTTAA